MCLSIKTLEEDLNNLTKVADKNIPVFKTLRSDNTSLHTCFGYRKFVKCEEVEFSYDISFRDYPEMRHIDIHRGYHSRKADGTGDWKKGYATNHLFVIPKGATYVEGGENDYCYNDGYVSNTIILIGRNTWLNRLIAYIKYNVGYKYSK
jgi:hypothetical protein